MVDLSPGYRELAPPPALRALVACLWVQVEDAARQVRVIPDACTDVVWRRGHGAWIAGPDTTAKLVSVAAGDVLVGVRFRPGAGGGALGVPLHELRNLSVEAAEVDRAFALDGALAPAEVLARFVSAAARREADPLVDEAARRLDGRSVRQVSVELFVSERQLRRRFHAAIGYGPKTFARVVRFRRFVTALDAGHTDLARLAVDAGYADQAHLTRETTRLAGLPPLALLRARTPG